MNILLFFPPWETIILIIYALSLDNIHLIHIHNTFCEIWLWFPVEWSPKNERINVLTVRQVKSTYIDIRMKFVLSLAAIGFSIELLPTVFSNYFLYGWGLFFDDYHSWSHPKYILGSAAFLHCLLFYFCRNRKLEIK